MDLIISIAVVFLALMFLGAVFVIHVQFKQNALKLRLKQFVGETIYSTHIGATFHVEKMKDEWVYFQVQENAAVTNRFHQHGKFTILNENSGGTMSYGRMEINDFIDIIDLDLIENK